MKPFDGGAWVGVSKIDNEQELWRAYEHSGTLVMNLQAGVVPYDYFVRCLGLGPQTRCINYDPGAPLHDRYQLDTDFLGRGRFGAGGHDAHDQASSAGTSTRAKRCARTVSGIRSTSPMPARSQVTSLHYHFPWLIKANVRWSLFCAATKRRMRPNLDWAPYFEVAGEDLPYRERLRAYARIAHERFETDRFQEFCSRHLGHLDEVAYELFGSPLARDAVHQKVSALFPPREIEEFTELLEPHPDVAGSGGRARGRRCRAGGRRVWSAR